MALTEREEVDRIEIIGEFNLLQIRTATIIENDGNEVARIFHRRVVSPASSVESESEDIKALAAQFHTADVKEEYQTFLANQNLL